MTVNCFICSKEIPQDSDGFLDRCARITRGDFRFDEDDNYDPSAETIKYERFICSHCFLTDPELCSFFNKLGDRVR